MSYENNPAFDDENRRANLAAGLSRGPVPVAPPAQPAAPAVAPAPGAFGAAQNRGPTASTGGGGPNWGEGAKGALGGAATGAVIGSAVPVPVVGTAIGAGAGAIIGGLFSGSSGPPKDGELKTELQSGRDTRMALANGIDNFQTRVAPQVSAPQLGNPAQMTAPTIAPVRTADTVTTRQTLVNPSVAATAGQAGPVSQVGPTTVGKAIPMNAANVRPAAQMAAAQIDGSREGDARAGQARLAGSLEMAANGQGGPSAAETMLGTALAKQTAAQMAMANSARGASAGRALRTAQINTGNAQTEAAGQVATLRAKEQMDARGQLAGALQGMRGTDVDVAQTQAQLNQGAATTNVGNQQQIQVAAMGNEQDANKTQFLTEADRLKEQARLDQERGMVNAGAINTSAEKGADRSTTVSIRNADGTDTTSRTQGTIDSAKNLQDSQLGTQTNISNAGSQNSRDDLAIKIQQQVGEKNMDAVNQFALETGKLGLEAAIANMESTLRARGMDDGYIAQLRGDLISMHGQGVSASSALAGKPTGPSFGDKMLDAGIDLGMAKLTGKLK